MINGFDGEIERLHGLGFAIHWLREKSKIPVESGWTLGERASIAKLKKKYRPGYNVGVRLGRASAVEGGYLAVLDVDIKSKKPEHRAAAEAALFELFPQCKKAPYLLSGRGNGSAHYYVRLAEPLAGQETKARSERSVKVSMPSVRANRREREKLTAEEIAAGLRLRPAWEVSLLSEGRQAAVVGSIHPDTRKAYVWGRKLESVGQLPLLDVGNAAASSAVAPRAGASARPSIVQAFPDVDADELGLRPDQVALIVDGAGMDAYENDRSRAVYALCMAMVQRKVPREKILAVLTRKDYFLGQTAYSHAKSENRSRAASWLDRCNLKKAESKVNDTDFDIEEIDETASPAKEKPRVAVLPQGVVKVGGWEEQLELRIVKGEAPRIKPTYFNLRLILGNCCEKPNFLKRDLFKMNDTYTCKTPWGSTSGDERSSGQDDALRVKNWLSETYGVEPHLSQIDEALNTVALENEYHPVKDYLLGLEWDGVERLEGAFKRYLGAEMSEPYLGAVTRKFFLACVMRIFEPGCKFDHVVVLEGNTGIGKSTFPSIMASEAWFLDSLPNLADKEAALYLHGTWICELGELAAVAKTSEQSAKVFISRRTDRIRPPYGHRRVDYPRSTVFLGSTDKYDYLTDTAGNRRWWPVWVKQCDFAALQRDRDQLWAEAMFNYDFCREPLFLEGEALEQAITIQEARRVEDEGDAMAVVFSRWVSEQLKQEGPFKSVRMSELFEAGPFVTYQMSRANIMRAGDVLRRAGYRKQHTRHGKLWIAD